MGALGLRLLRPGRGVWIHSSPLSLPERAQSQQPAVSSSQEQPGPAAPREGICKVWDGAEARGESAATRWPAPIPTPIRPSSNGPDTGRARLPGAEEWRRSGSGVLNVRHTIKRGRRGCEAAWSAPRENFAGRFPASPISSQRPPNSAQCVPTTISARAIPMASKLGSRRTTEITRPIM